MDIKKILNIINPQPAIDGLEISSSGLRFIGLNKDNLRTATLQLPAGVIKEGKIKDRSQFVSALSELHSQITRQNKKRIYVIVGIPDVNIYTQVFNLPVLGSNNLEEAARLNLQMISPVDFSDTYHDWQPVGENRIDGHQMEILGALAPKKIIDDFSSALEEANFGVVAIEFPALSLARLSTVKTPYLLLRLASDGLNLNIIRNGNLYFNHFVFWADVVKEEGKISFSDFKDLIIKEVQKVLNFYETHWEGKIDNVLLTGSGLIEETAKIISTSLSLEVQLMVLQKFSQLSPDYHIALSLALRGGIPRSQDTIVSLASVGTEEKFQRYRIINFVNIWRNIILASIIFVVVIFGLTDWFLIKTLKSTGAVIDLTKTPETAEFNILQDKAGSFNKIVELALKAKQVSSNWSSVFETINNSANSANVTLKRIFIQSVETPALIDATAVNQEAAINFKNLLIQQPQFSDVNLPLSRILVSVDGSAEFSISFRIRQ